MSAGAVPLPSAPQRKYAAHTEVVVTPKNGGEAFTGKIARSPKGNAYVVEKDDGTRYYADVHELSAGS